MASVPTEPTYAGFWPRLGALLIDSLVWLPVGEQTAELAAALEARAVITRPFAGEGIRVTVGTPEEDDVFLAALDDVRSGARVA